MNYSQLINDVSSKAMVNRADTKKVVDALKKVMADEVASGGKITLTGFATFSVSKKAGGLKKCFGKEIQLDDRYAPVVRFSASLKKKLHA